MLLAEELLALDEELLGMKESVFFRNASPGRLSMPPMNGPIPVHILAALSEPNSIF